MNLVQHQGCYAIRNASGEIIEHLCWVSRARIAHVTDALPVGGEALAITLRQADTLIALNAVGSRRVRDCQHNALVERWR
jgi:hypothetical protein